MFIILKKITFHVRTSLKMLLLVIIATMLIAAAVIIIYKPTYSVSLNGEFIGYTENKIDLQNRINEYMQNGEQEHTAFVQIDKLPEYKLCLIKKENNTTDEEIFNKVKQTGVTYFRYYAIADNAEEKSYVSTFAEAEKVVEELKNKKSTNKENLSIIEKYETELKELVDTEKSVASLYVAPKATVKKVSTASYTSTGTTSYVTGSATVANIGVSFARPVSGNITSRFGGRGSGTHTGLDIAAPNGTAIKAAASGTVTFSGGNPSRSYGYYIIISHGNGVQTLYGHCSKLLVSAGQTVSQGQHIANVGSTGNSTGNHLHFEVRINGAKVNPQRYVY